MTDVFISYKREERARCARIADLLRAQGLDVWFDASLESGASFDVEIEQRLHAAKAVLVLWSPGAATSHWVRNEATIGQERKVLVSVEIAPCRRPVQFTTTHTEALPNAAFAETDPAWLRILARIGRLTGRRDLAALAPAVDVATPKRASGLGPLAPWALGGVVLIAATGAALYLAQVGPRPAQRSAEEVTTALAPADVCADARANLATVVASDSVAAISADLQAAPPACSRERLIAEARQAELRRQAVDATSARQSAVDTQTAVDASVRRAFAGVWVAAPDRGGECGRLPWRFEPVDGRAWRRIDSGGDAEPFSLVSASPPTLRYDATGLRIVAERGELMVVPNDGRGRCALQRQ